MFLKERKKNQHHHQQQRNIGTEKSVRVSFLRKKEIKLVGSYLR